MCDLQNTLNLVYNVAMRSLGESLRELRTLAGFSQKEFAEKLGTTQQRVSEWEMNKCEPSLYRVVKILAILDITFDELIDGVDFDLG